jgi:hypothetical protein
MLRRLPVLSALVAALALVPAAMASSVLPEGASIDPLLSQIATGIAGGPTQVYCHTPSDWAPPDGDPGHGGYATPPNRIDISPTDCDALEAYASAEVKPTMCTTRQAVDSTITEKVRYRKKVWKRVHGKRVRRTVWRTRTIVHPVQRTVLGSEPCSKGSLDAFDVSLRSPGYSGYAHAIHTVAHEAIHVLDFRTGVAPSETHAECAGMDAAPSVAVALGGTLEDGQALAAFYGGAIRPRYTDPAYTQPC